MALQRQRREKVIAEQRGSSLLSHLETTIQANFPGLVVDRGDELLIKKK